MTGARQRKHRRVAAVCALAAGCLMVGILALVPRANDDPVACSEKPFAAQISAPRSRHPPQRFFAPGEEVPRRDLAYSVGHGYVVVSYQPGLSQAEQDSLADWAVTADLVVVAPANEKQKEMVRAETAGRRLSCDETDVKALTDFRDRWSESASR